MVNEERDNIEELDREVDRENLLYEFKGKKQKILILVNILQVQKTKKKIL